MDWNNAFGSDWGGRGITGLLGVAAAGGTAWFTGQRKGKSVVRSELQAEAAKAAHMVLGDMRSLLDAQGGEIKRLGTALIDERAQCELRLSAMQTQINELMAAPVAGYGE